jgi:hypothetical protein
MSAAQDIQFVDTAGFLDLPIEQLRNPTIDQRIFLIESLFKVNDPNLSQSVPLVLNPMQRDIFETLEDNEISLKWRRAGMTTVYVAVGLLEIITKPAVNVELFAHNDETAKQIFQQIIEPMYESIPYQVRPKADRSTVNRLVFKELGSQFVVSTAGQSIKTSESKGQARTINILICTEFAYMTAAEEFFAKAINCVPKVGGRIYIDSTPNGQNSFHSRFTLAKAGRGSFKPRFYPWWWSDLNFFELDEGETFALSDDEMQLGEGNPYFDAKEVGLRHRWFKRYIKRGCQLLPEQIKWRRATIENIRPLGSLTSTDRFRVEFPEDAESCFLHSGRPLMGPDDCVKRCEPQEPLEGHEYVIGQDTSTGSANGHPAGMVVIDITDETSRQVYSWIGWEPTDMQAEQVKLLAERYNDALIVCERNTPGDTVLTLLRRWGVSNVYMHKDHAMKEGGKKESMRKPGFPTSNVTKPRAFTELQDSLHRRELLLCCPLTCAELKSMQYDHRDIIVYAGIPQLVQETGLESHGELAIAIALAWHGRKSGGPGIA